MVKAVKDLIKRSWLQTLLGFFFVQFIELIEKFEKYFSEKKTKANPIDSDVKL